jgi:hypothetical protein
VVSLSLEFTPELPESTVGFSEECSREESTRLFREGNGGGHEEGENSGSISPNMLWREPELRGEGVDSSELEDLCVEFGIFSVEGKRRGNAGGLDAFSILNPDKISGEEAEGLLNKNQLFSFRKCVEVIKREKK